MASSSNGLHMFESLIADLRRSCGVQRGDVLIVHSSMKSLGHVDGGPAVVIAALQEVVGMGGTILMPAFSSPPADGVIDQRTTPSRVGLLTETFRISLGVVRSAHPTHSVCAWGARAHELTAEHLQTSGLGVGCPLHRAALAGAHVMMIGCRLTSCSLIHVAEATMRVPYLGQVTYPGYDRTLTFVDQFGKRHMVPPRDVPGDSEGFDVAAQQMEVDGLIHHGRLGQAEVLKFSGVDCLAAAEELLRRDPAALLCHQNDCGVCRASRKIISQRAVSQS